MLNKQIRKAADYHFKNKIKVVVKEVAKKTYKLLLYARSETTIDHIVNNLPYLPNEEIRVLRSGCVACFYTENENLQLTLSNDINGIISLFDKLTLREINKSGWVEDYDVFKLMFNTSLSNDYYIEESIDAVKKIVLGRVKIQKEEDDYAAKEKAFRYKMKNKSFDDEVLAIFSYMEKEFAGFESPNNLRAVLNDLFNYLKQDADGFFFATEDAGEEQLMALNEFYKVRCGKLMSFIPLSSLDIKRPNTLVIWERNRTIVNNLIKSHLPNLSINNLKTLLKDENAELPVQTKFLGMNFTTQRSMTLEERLSPHNLHCLQKEQGRTWRSVFAGALVAHYHHFLELKQEAYIKNAMVLLGDKLLQDNKIVIEDHILDIYKSACRINW